MIESIGIQEYIEKRLKALDLIDSEPKQFSMNKGEVVVGVIVKERTKKLFYLSKILSKEIENLCLKLEKVHDGEFKDSRMEEVKSAAFEMTRLDCVKKILDAEFQGTLYYEFPKIKDYLASNLCVAVQKDWKVIVITGELVDALSEFLLKEELKSKFMTPPSMS